MPVWLKTTWVTCILVLPDYSTWSIAMVLFLEKKGNIVEAGRNTYFVLIKNRTHSSTRHKVKGIEQIG